MLVQQTSESNLTYKRFLDIPSSKLYRSWKRICIACRKDITKHFTGHKAIVVCPYCNKSIKKDMAEAASERVKEI